MKNIVNKIFIMKKVQNFLFLFNKKSGGNGGTGTVNIGLISTGTYVAD